MTFFISRSAEIKGRNERGHGAPDRQPIIYSNLKIALDSDR